MDNHPIPEDVIGFKFKLIGSITVKQFLYLLSSGILIAAVLVFPLFVIVKIPFITIFALIGLSLAFLPIDGRPLDIMVLNFLKTLPSENRYIYQKAPGQMQILSSPQSTADLFVPPVNTSAEEAKREILLHSTQPPKFIPDEKESGFFEKIKSFFENEKLNLNSPQNKPLPHQKAPIANLDKTEEGLKNELSEAKQMQSQDNTPELQAKIATLQNLLSQASRTKEDAGKKIINEQIKNAQNQNPSSSPTGSSSQNQSAQFVAPQSQFNSGFPSLPEVGNVIIGIVKDSRGRVIPNILVEVIDQKNIPVRTFKTNSLGQFMSATQLANGTYHVFFEDPQKIHEFQKIEMVLKGDILQPLEVISIDQREKLRQELFDGRGN